MKSRFCNSRGGNLNNSKRELVLEKRISRLEKMIKEEFDCKKATDNLTDEINNYLDTVDSDYEIKAYYSPAGLHSNVPRDFPVVSIEYYGRNHFAGSVNTLVHGPNNYEVLDVYGEFLFSSRSVRELVEGLLDYIESQR